MTILWRVLNGLVADKHLTLVTPSVAIPGDKRAAGCFYPGDIVSSTRDLTNATQGRSPRFRIAESVEEEAILDSGPSRDPKDWTVESLEEFAADREVDISEASTKREMIEVLVAEKVL